MKPDIHCVGTHWNPGYMTFQLGSRGRDTGHGNGLRAHEYQGYGRNPRQYPRTVPALQGGDPGGRAGAVVEFGHAVNA